MSAKADLHCHSSASERSKLGVSRALGLPECATPPEEVYALAKRRGMDFVTITDHDTIDGVLEIADRPDVFIGEELTARFAGEPQAVHILCLGITPDDHEHLQERAGDVEAVADYLHGNEITCALAHPFYAVAAPLTTRHRRRLAELFGTWEVRNGARAPELNQPAWVYVETRGGIGVGGSDDHAGIDIGRTWSQTPDASTPSEYLAHIRDGRVIALGDHGSAAKWAHAAMAIAVRTIGPAGTDAAPDPAAVLRIAERVMSEGDARAGAIGADLEPGDAQALLGAWLRAVGLDVGTEQLLALLQAEGFRHRDLYRRARRAHERALHEAVTRAVAAAAAVSRPPTPAVPATVVGHTGSAGRGGDSRPVGLTGHTGPAVAAGSAGPGGATGPGGSAEPVDWAAIAGGLFGACVAAIPYVPATAFLGREKVKLVARDDDPVRVALVADGLATVHGVSRTLAEIAERGVPGFEVELIGTDAGVDRRLGSVTEVALPFAPEVVVGVPGLPAVVEALAEGRYDLVHLSSPGPVGVMAAVTARVLGLPTAGAYHTELGAYAAERSGDLRVEMAMQALLAGFYGSFATVLSPSAAGDASLAALGVEPDRIARWDRGVDLSRFSPLRRRRNVEDRELRVLYAGRLTREKGTDLLADAFLAAHEREPRLQLVIAGGGPEEATLRERLGDRVTFLGWLDGDALATAYASADVFLFCSQTDTFGQVVLEAQASGLPVVAVDAGGPGELIDDGRTGLLCAPDAEAIAIAVAALAPSLGARDRLSRDARAVLGERSWDSALARLAAGGGAGSRPRRPR